MSPIVLELHAAPELLAAINALAEAFRAESCVKNLNAIPAAAPAVVHAQAAAPIAPDPVPVAPPASPLTPAVPVAPGRTYRFDELQVAAVALADAGKRDDVLALMGQFGAQALSQLAPARYGEFATALRGLGAKL